jgi:hypothetical protein
MTSHENGRTAELLADSLRWVDEDAEASDLLGADGDVVAAQIARETDADPLVAIGVSGSSSERNNRLEEKQFEVRALVDASTSFVEDSEAPGSLLELIELKDRVVDILTTSRDGWGAEGVTADEEVAFDDERNRYLGVTSVTYERTDPNTTYE